MQLDALAGISHWPGLWLVAIGQPVCRRRYCDFQHHDIVKAFQEQRIRGDFTHIVFGVLIVEDLIAIVLIAILTALSAGESLGPMDLALTGGRLALFLVVLTVGRTAHGATAMPPPSIAWVATKPRSWRRSGWRLVLHLSRRLFGYSVALGAFIAGGLVAESGVERSIERLVQPVTDVFAALFFVSVGMLIDPVDIAAHWLA